jgi:hypothetical protein
VGDALVAYATHRFRLEKESSWPTSATPTCATRAASRANFQVLDVESRLFTAELDLVLANLNERTAVVPLYRALGGDWKHVVPAGPAPVTARPARTMRIIEDMSEHLPPRDRS